MKFSIFFFALLLVPQFSNAETYYGFIGKQDGQLHVTTNKNSINGLGQKEPGHSDKQGMPAPKNTMAKDVVVSTLPPANLAPPAGAPPISSGPPANLSGPPGMKPNIVPDNLIQMVNRDSVGSPVGGNHNIPGLDAAMAQVQKQLQDAGVTGPNGKAAEPAKENAAAMTGAIPEPQGNKTSEGNQGNRSPASIASIPNGHEDYPIAGSQMGAPGLGMPQNSGGGSMGSGGAPITGVGAPPMAVNPANSIGGGPSNMGGPSSGSFASRASIANDPDRPMASQSRPGSSGASPSPSSISSRPPPAAGSISGPRGRNGAAIP